MAAATLSAYDMLYPHMLSMGKIALGNFSTLETEWKQKDYNFSFWRKLKNKKDYKAQQLEKIGNFFN